MDEEVKKKIDDMVQSQKVVLFMKGTPEMPECGFSAQVSGVLAQLGIEYKAINVFDDESIRQGIKEYGNWPTIPQLYIDGKLVGGCDIVSEMAQSGELQKMVGASA